MLLPLRTRGRTIVKVGVVMLAVGVVMMLAVKGAMKGAIVLSLLLALPVSGSKEVEEIFTSSRSRMLRWKKAGGE
jgi:hypothetical protein